ncbi:hypothetical protein TNCV_742861 [Trichonephila clavipes]|nr:hypothetical protein TNCV_742861 [Trichonephila clavipes]
MTQRMRAKFMEIIASTAPNRCTLPRDLAMASGILHTRAELLSRDSLKKEWLSVEFGCKATPNDGFWWMYKNFLLYVRLFSGQISAILCSNKRVQKTVGLISLKNLPWESIVKFHPGQKR